MRVPTPVERLAVRQTPSAPASALAPALSLLDIVMAVAGLVPLDYKDRPAEPVTLSEGQNNGK